MNRHLLESTTSDVALPQTALAEVPVQRLRRGEGPQPVGVDQVVVEAPVALCFNGLSHAVMMATPTALDALGLGFALSEGIIEAPEHCHDLVVLSQAQGTEVQMQISTRAFEALKGQRRSMEGRSGCGLCGIDSLAALGQWAGEGPGTDAELRQTQRGEQAPIGVNPILRAIEQLPAHQHLNQHSGGCHAAGWASIDGQLQAVFEDVGRHNALDKLIGTLARNGRLGEPGFVVLSSRGSHELVRKCARVGIAALATISAPTAMGVRVAELAGLRLWGLCRPPRAVLYAAGGGASAAR